MSPISIAGTKTALRAGLTASFLASGGTAPYTYSVDPNGAGGTVDPSGNYQAPAATPTDPRRFYDFVRAKDSAGATAAVPILVGAPWQLVGEVIQQELGLALDRWFFWNQKAFQPKDDLLYVPIGIAFQKPYSSGKFPSGAATQAGPGADQVTKFTAVQATLDIHLISRGLDAINRLPEVFTALCGPYSEQQQEANGFFLARLPHQATDLSGLDGDAIPYHYVVSIDMMYQFTQVVSPDYYGTLPTPTILTNS